MVAEYAKPFLTALKSRRETLGISAESLENDLVLGPGWVDAIESGDVKVDLAMFVYIAKHLDLDLAAAMTALPSKTAIAAVPRNCYAIPADEGIYVVFDYAGTQAKYHLPEGSVESFDDVLIVLRDGLAKANRSELDASGVPYSKSRAVVDAFQAAMSSWKGANGSDVWWFVVYRAYLDQYNHPAATANGDLAQSWIRTSGWALERCFVDNYRAPLDAHGIRISIETEPEKSVLLAGVKVDGFLNNDKVDVILSALDGNGERFAFGVVHVKASFAERRTDDVPLSLSLLSAGYCSPLLTLDCKSMPSETPLNRGELGTATGSRSDKRLDIERDGVFSGVFSYNLRTEPTADPEAKSRVQVSRFDSTDDAFVQHVVDYLAKFKSERGLA